MTPELAEFLLKAPLAIILMIAIITLYRDQKTREKQTMAEMAVLQANFIAALKEIQLAANVAIRELTLEGSTRLRDQRSDFAAILRDDRDGHAQQIALIQDLKRG